jgi:hypothetical protein
MMIATIPTTMKERPRRARSAKTSRPVLSNSHSKTANRARHLLPMEHDAAAVAVLRLGHGDKWPYDSCRHLCQK